MDREKTRLHEPRASWKGQLKLGLVAVPVLAYNVAARREGEIHFHQLHAACHSRIHYEKVCPIHGEVTKDEIVSGYEFAEDQYVEVRDEELERLRTDKEQSLTIDRFIHPDDLDPIYFDGRAYYLVPEGDEAQEGYAVLRTAIENKGLYGVGQIVLSQREQLVILRPLDGLLAFQMLNYNDQLRSAERFRERVDPRTPPADEVALAEELVEASVSEQFDVDEYEDPYTDKLRTLIKAKMAGAQVVAPPEAEVQPEVISLRDALRRSVDRARSGSAEPIRPRSKRNRRVS